MSEDQPMGDVAKTPIAPPPPPIFKAVPPGMGLPVKLRPCLPKAALGPREEVRLLLGQLRHSLMKQGVSSDDLLFLSHYQPVAPLIQEGPMCGLVAMCMASRHLGKTITINKALEAARSNNYTIQGEMFSALQVGELSRSLCGCEYTLTRGDMNYAIIVNGLMTQKIILVPYDADRNNEPGLKRGHKAHWAVLSGILRVFDRADRNKLIGDQYEQDHMIPNLYYPKNINKDSSHLEVLELEAHQQDLGTIPNSLYDYVFAKQGKSAHTKLWSLKELLESNRNLIEVGDQIWNDRKHFVIPGEGIEKTLCDIILTLHPGR